MRTKYRKPSFTKKGKKRSPNFKLKTKKNLLTLFSIVFFLLPNLAFFSSITSQDIIIQSNKVRLENNLNKLEPNILLVEAARNKANDIFKYQTFEHNIDNKTFSDWIKKTDYDYYYVGENLAIDFMVTEKVVDAWMESESHRANILNKNFTEIGVAIVDGKFKDRNTTVVVQVFGSQMNNISSIGTISDNSKIEMSQNHETPVANQTSNKVNNFLIILLATTAFMITIVKIAVVLEHHHHKKRKKKLKLKQIQRL